MKERRSPAIGQQHGYHPHASGTRTLLPILFVLVALVVSIAWFFSPAFRSPNTAPADSLFVPMDGNTIQHTLPQQDMVMNGAQEIDPLEMSKSGKQNLKGNFAKSMQEKAIAEGKDICSYLQEQRLFANSTKDNKLLEDIIELEKAFKCRNMQKRQER